MATSTKPEKRKAVEVLGEIEQALASIDGISTGDAFRIGGLVREYGQTCASESMGPLLDELFNAVLDPKKGPPNEPWR